MRSRTEKLWRIERGKYFALEIEGVRFGRGLSNLEYVCARFHMWLQGGIEGIDFVVLHRLNLSDGWWPMLIPDPLWEPRQEAAT